MDQDVLGNDKGLDYLLDLVPDDDLRDKCRKALGENLPDSVDKWKKFTREVEDHNKDVLKEKVNT